MPKRNLPATVLRIPASIFSLVVHAYRATLSPDHGPLRHLYPYGFCRHEPTCSSYALDVLRERSLLRALGLIARRVLSCHPWKKPGDARLLASIRRHAGDDELETPARKE